MRELPHALNYDKTREMNNSSHEGKTRDPPPSSNEFCQPCATIPYKNDDFAPIKLRPISHDFTSTSSSPKIDEEMDKVRKK